MNSKKSEKYNKAITILIFLAVFMSRLVYINHPAAEAGELWRQTDTESIARNFIKYRFNIFYPQLNYDGVPPNYVQLEFQITTFIIAVLYKLFEYHIWLARLVPIGFFMFSVLFLYLTAKRFYTIYQTWSVIIIYSMLPLTMFLSRAIMPEAALLCFFCGSFYFFLKWLDDKRFLTLIWASIFTCLSILQKPQSAFIGLAMLAMCIEKFRLRIFKQWRLLFFAIISLAPPAFYFLWSASFAKQKFVNKIALRHIFPNIFTALFSEKALEFYKKCLPEAFTYPVLILALIMLFSMLNKKERPVFYWTIAMLMEAALIVSVIRFKYYLILLSPVLALLCGKLIGLLGKINYIGGVLLLVIFIYYTSYSFKFAKKDFEVNYEIYEAVDSLNKLTKQKDLIVISTFDPMLLTISDRAGWRANLKYHEEIPKEMVSEMNYFINNGADYFFVYKNEIYNDKDGAYLNYLNENYQVEARGKDFTLFALS